MFEAIGKKDGNLSQKSTVRSLKKRRYFIVPLVFKKQQQQTL